MQDKKERETKYKGVERKRKKINEEKLEELRKLELWIKLSWPSFNANLKTQE